MRGFPTRRARGLGAMWAPAFLITVTVAGCGNAASDSPTASVTATATTSTTSSATALPSATQSGSGAPEATSTSIADAASSTQATPSPATTSASPTQNSTTSAQAQTSSAQAKTSNAEKTGWIDCAAAKALVEPGSITTNCISMTDKVTGIEWESWDNDKAVGTGELGEKKVVITLTDPIQAATGAMVFSDLLINGVPVKT